MRKLLASLLLLVAVPLFAGEDWKTINIGPFSGLDTRDSRPAMPASGAANMINIDVTPGGKSLKKRPGYAAAFTTGVSSAITGSYLFYTSTGAEVALIFSERRFFTSFDGSGLTTIYSTATSGAYYDCSDYLGLAYCVNSARDGLFRTDGVSVSTIAITSTGTIVAASPTRLGVAGFSGSAASRIDFSAETDLTSWGTGALGTSPVQITINAPGSKITHLTYAFGRWLWFKESSFGYIIQGVQPAQTDWVIKTVSNDIGTLENTSTVDPEGNLYFRGRNKRIYRYDGNSISEFSNEILGTIQITTGSSTGNAAYSTYFDNKLIFTAGTSSINSYWFVYNFNSNAWSTYTIPSNGFHIRNNQLYFGSANAVGKVYLFGSGNSDDGSAIAAVWASKPFFFDSPFKRFQLANVSVFADVAVATATVTYFGGGGATRSFDFYMSRSTSPLSTYINKNIPAGSDYQDVSLIISESSSNEPFEIYGMQLGVRPRTWRPEP